jgi:hypothetical protein
MDPGGMPAILACGNVSLYALRVEEESAEIKPSSAIINYISLIHTYFLPRSESTSFFGNELTAIR